MTHEELGALIAGARKSKGYSVRLLAEKTGLPHSTIVNIENARINAGIKIYLRLFQELGIKIVV